MKSYLAPSSDPANPEKFLAYMVPSLDEVDIPCILHIIYPSALQFLLHTALTFNLLILIELLCHFIFHF